MDDSPRDRVQMTETCPRCGAPRAGPGRFCAQCGADVFTLPAAAAADSAAQQPSRPQPTPRRALPQEVLLPEAWPEIQPRRTGGRRAVWLVVIALLVIAAGVVFATRSGMREPQVAREPQKQQQNGIVAPVTDSARVSAGATAERTDSERGQVAAAPAPRDTTPATRTVPQHVAATPSAPKHVAAEPPRAPRKVPTRVRPEPHVPPVTPVVITCESAYTQRNWDRAASLCATDAEAGNASSARLLGTMYDQGLGVPRDPSQAVAWYRRAALLGDAGAQLSLGHAYERGQGVPRDYGEAFAWLSKAAAQGNARAQYDVGIMYAAGRGTAQSDTAAVRWFRKAAAQGQGDAARELGRRGIVP